MNKLEKLNNFTSPEERLCYLSLFFNDIDSNLPEIKLLLDRINWKCLFYQARENHLFGFFYRVFKRLNFKGIPEDFVRGCRDHFFFNETKNHLYSNEIKKFNSILKSNNIQYVITRGLVYCDLFYQRLPIREFNDIDVYMDKNDIKRTIDCMEKAGYKGPGKYKVNYFLKHHIHIRVENPHNKITFEIHWKVDHNYNLMNVPVKKMLSTCRTVIIDGIKVPVPSLENDFLLSAVHVLKHSPLLKYIRHEKSLYDNFFCGGYSVKYLDLLLFIKNYRKDIDWDLMGQLSREYYCEEHLKVVLDLIKKLFDAPVDKGLLKDLDYYRPGFIENKIAHYFISRNNYKAKNDLPSRFIRRLMIICERGLIFNPIRLIDIINYLWPPRKYLYYLKMKNVSYLKRNRAYLFVRGMGHLMKNTLDLVLGRNHLLLED